MRRRMEHTNAYECHDCSTLFARKPRYDKHAENCAEIPGIVNRFENQNLLTFENNLKYQGNLLFVAYCDLRPRPLVGVCTIPKTVKSSLCPMSSFLLFISI